MKKVLFIATRPVNPMKDGRTYLIDQYCGIMAKSLNYEVYLACFGLEKVQPEYFKKVFSLEEPYIVEMSLNVLIKSLITRKWPIQASMMYSRKTNRNIERIVDEIHPDIIICDMIRTAPYVRRIKGDIAKVLDIDDLLSKRYVRQSRLKNLDETTLGQIKDRIPTIFVSLAIKLDLIKAFLRFEARLMEKYELSETKLFDEVFFCSPQDMEDFNKKSEKKASCVHVAVDIDRFKGMQTNSYDRDLIGYLGNIDIAANKDNLRYIIKNLLPEIREEDSDISLLVIGKCSEKSYEEFNNCDGVKFTFYVDDISEYVSKCLAIVAPIQYGSGIKIKIMESMAMRIPVITNKLGVEGLKAENKKDILVCDTPRDFYNRIKELKNNPSERDRIGENGYKYIENNHALVVARDDLEGVLARAVG